MAATWTGVGARCCRRDAAVARSVEGFRGSGPLAYVKYFAAPALLGLLVVLWILIQTFALPTGWGGSSSLQVDTIARPLFFLAGERELSLTGLMRLLTYFGIFLVATDVGSTGRGARLLFGFVVWGAVVYTAYAMFATALDQTRNLAIYVPQKGQFTGPFINRNNYATYAALAAVTSIVLALGTISQHQRDEARRSRWARRLGIIGGMGSIWLAAAAMLTVGVVLSESRGGWLSLSTGAVAGVVLLVRRGKWLFVASGFGGLMLFTFLMPWGTHLLSRMSDIMTTGLPGRAELFEVALPAIRQHPATRWGSNTFESLFLLLQPPLCFTTTTRRIIPILNSHQNTASRPQLLWLLQ